MADNKKTYFFLWRIISKNKSSGALSITLDEPMFFWNLIMKQFHIKNQGQAKMNLKQIEEEPSTVEDNSPVWPSSIWLKSETARIN